MSTKHTPGPWHCRMQNAAYIGYYIETVDMSHQNTFIGEVGGGLQSNAEVKANAQLIAAAPELLNACKAALSYIREMPTDFEEGLEEGDISLPHQLRQAIKNAESNI